MKNNRLLVFTERTSSRFKYVCEHIFTHVMGLECDITEDRLAFRNHNGAKLNYAKEALDGAVWITPSGLLNEDGIQTQNIAVFRWKDLPVFFETSKEADLPFDLFSIVFYLMSRYEEHLPNVKTDKHDRYLPEQSLAYQNNFLEFPLLDVLITELEKLLLEQFSFLSLKSKSYTYQPTFDIDVLFAHKSKPFWRLLGGSLKDLMSLRLQNIWQRILVQLKIETDPYDIFDTLYEAVKEIDNRPLCFVNLGKYTAYDKNNSFKNLAVFDLLKSINERFSLGIHPSYFSNDDEQLLKNERMRFKYLFGEWPTKSRQHFIRMQLPFTYRSLIKHGILHDYSMGYASVIGFRASTAKPFYFYDLVEEKQTELQIHPFAFMDGTLFDYLKLSTEESIGRIDKMANLVKTHGGEMIGIWHQSYIAEQKNCFVFFNEINRRIC